MDNEALNRKLYEKLFEEQGKYKSIQAPTTKFFCQNA